MNPPDNKGGNMEKLVETAKKLGKECTDLHGAIRDLLRRQGEIKRKIKRLRKRLRKAKRKR
jgi:hypothetical protein